MKTLGQFTCCILSLIAVACGTGAPGTVSSNPTGADHPEDEPTEQVDAAAPDPVAEPPPPNEPVIQDPRATQLMLDETGSAPVVAERQDGTPRFAWIDTETGRAVLGDGTRRLGEFPGEGDVESVALVSDRAAGLHALWVTSGEVLYSHVDELDQFSAPRRVTDLAGRDATLAAGPSGELVVAFTTSGDPAAEAESERPQIVVARCSTDAGCANFAEHETVFTARLYAELSGPSLAVDAAGAAHVVFEWTDFGTAIIEYVTDAGGSGFAAEPITITRAAWSPCPAIAVDEATVDVTFVSNDPYLVPRDVRHVKLVEGVVQPSKQLYASDWNTTMALIAPEPSGGFHLAVTEVSSDERRIMYGKPGSDESLEITRAPAISLTPVAGGALRGSEAVYFSYTRSNGTSSSAEVLRYTLP